MKKPGHGTEYMRERRAELTAQMRRLMSQARRINMRELATQVVNQPASRFWVSEERACVVVLAMESGQEILEGMRPAKREMFREIHRRYRAMKERRPESPAIELVSAIVYQAAPKHYLEPRAALEEIYRHRGRRKKT